jgi:CBASS immunity sensor of nucleotide second messenger signals
LLSGLEAAGKAIGRLHVFPALSLSAGIVLGRVVDPHVHPTLVIYDRTPSGYQPVLETR